MRPRVKAASLAVLILISMSPRLFARTCESLTGLSLANAAITKVESISTTSFTPAGGTPLNDLPPLCRVVLQLTPTPDSNIGVEIWLPLNGWNGRFEGTGNGGFAGRIVYASLAAGVKHGYAVANTDMGMAPPPGGDASVFIGHPERWTDWGSRATHEMTVAGKQVVRAFYGRNSRHAYFAGCSTGGEQALMEAQRFPDDYDGIAGGAPGHNRTGVHTSILWNYAVAHRDEAAGIPAGKLSLLTNAVVAACDAKDGVRDGVLSDPRICGFRPEALQCNGPNRDDCLTAAQVDTVRKFYSGPTNSRTGQHLYPGMQPGSESGWKYYFANTPPPYAAIFRWVFGAEWNWKNFEFDRDFDKMNAQLASSVNATNPDLSRFRKAGHKFILYHGWADWLVVPGESIAYWEAVRNQDKTERTSDYLRLFMVPGMQHCYGGPGADKFDALESVAAWVEHGVAPDKIIATKYVDGDPAKGVAFSRPLCPYPQEAKFNGEGNPSGAQSFHCQ